MNVLVIGGTGTVGSEVVTRLLDAQNGTDTIRIMTRSTDKVETLPEGAEGVIGDLKEKDSLPRAFRGVDRVFFVTTPASGAEEETGLNAVAAAVGVDVEKIVYMSVHRADDAMEIPHFREKVAVEDAVKESGIEYTILRPNIFYQNDFWFEEPVTEHGAYSQPIGNVGLHGVDVRDVAAAAVRALFADKFNGQTYSIVGPELITGNEVARLYSKHLDTTVRYTGDDLDQWMAQQKQFLPDWLVDDLSIMYDHFLKHGLKATADDHAQTQEILGRAPRSYEPFVREVAAQWTQTRDVQPA